MTRHTLDVPRDLVDLLRPSERLSPTPEAPEDDFPAILARMTPGERISASRHGGFTRRERSVWAAQFPEELPLINGEFEWLVSNLADLD